MQWGVSTNRADSTVPYRDLPDDPLSCGTGVSFVKSYSLS